MSHPDCEDDSSIKDSTLLLRRVLKSAIDNGRITAAAFAPPKKDPGNLHCSVDINLKRDPMELLGALFSKDINYEKRIDNARKRLGQGHKVVAVKAKTPRIYNQKIFSSPCEEEFRNCTATNGAHAIICGKKDDELLQILAEEASQNIILG